jgi:hypothetical protein
VARSMHRIRILFEPLEQEVRKAGYLVGEPFRRATGSHIRLTEARAASVSAKRSECQSIWRMACGNHQ